MWAILQANYTSGAHCLCPGNSDWWGESRCFKKWPSPTTITKVWSFLGFMGYYCWFIPKFTWNNRCQQSFDNQKYLCITAHILAYTDVMKPFKLHTDTCRSGLGAVLYQIHDDGTDAIIVYASRSLTKAETHYPTHKLEFLTLKWVMVKKFHKYLYGSTFDIYTNNMSSNESLSGGQPCQL